jgi:hypothetical protein
MSPLPSSNNTADDNTGGAIWSSIESNVGVVCASLPHFKPLFDRFFPNLMGRTSRWGKVSENSANGKYAKHSIQHHGGYEMENGKRIWKDTYTGTSNDNIAVDIEGGSDSHVHGLGREMTRDEIGIFKSTRVVISRDPVESIHDDEK